MNVKSGRLPASKTLPPAKKVDHPPLRFSFKHLDLTNPNFALAGCAGGYLEKFLERLKSLCALTAREFRTNKTSSLKAHTITWSETREPSGFTCLNSQLREEEPWQFEITKNEHGRVHGFLLDDTFYIVWIDPSHYLYS